VLFVLFASPIIGVNLASDHILRITSGRDIITKINARYPEAQDFLRTLKKGLLALNDFASRLSFGEGLDVLEAVMRSGQMHPDYSAALNGRLRKLSTSAGGCSAKR
jgi:hypothetical protein